MASSAEIHIVLRNMIPPPGQSTRAKGCAWISIIGKINRHDQSHFFHLKKASGPIAAAIIKTIAT